MSRSSSVEPEPEKDFAGLYARTFGRVWGILGRVGIRRTAERHEVAQDVYLVVHRKLAARDPKVPESAWVGAIAWRVGLRYVALRRTQKEQPMDEPSSEELAAAPGPTAEEAVGRRRRYHDIMGSVESPDRFELYRPFCEAEQERISEGVLARLAIEERARRRLRVVAVVVALVAIALDALLGAR